MKRCLPDAVFARRRAPRRGQPRRGIVLVCVVVCLAVAMVVVAGGTHRVLTSRRQFQVETQARQAKWLLEAGAERAFRAWLDDANYEGEVWSITADQLDGPSPGLVTIRVIPAPSEDDVTLRVSAEYPADVATSVRCTREFKAHRPQLVEN